MGKKKEKKPVIQKKRNKVLKMYFNTVMNEGKNVANELIDCIQELTTDKKLV